MTATRADHLVLRGQMLRRLPTEVDLAQRVPIVLTERDRDILFAVYQQGFITTDLACRRSALYGDSDSAGGPPCQERERQAKGSQAAGLASPDMSRLYCLRHDFPAVLCEPI